MFCRDSVPAVLPASVLGPGLFFILVWIITNPLMKRAHAYKMCAQQQRNPSLIEIDSNKSSPCDDEHDEDEGERENQLIEEWHRDGQAKISNRPLPDVTCQPTTTQHCPHGERLNLEGDVGCHHKLSNSDLRTSRAPAPRASCLGRCSGCVGPVSEDLVLGRRFCGFGPVAVRVTNRPPSARGTHARTCVGPCVASVVAVDHQPCDHVSTSLCGLPLPSYWPAAPPMTHALGACDGLVLLACSLSHILTAQLPPHASCARACSAELMTSLPATSAIPHVTPDLGTRMCPCAHAHGRPPILPAVRAGVDHLLHQHRPVPGQARGAAQPGRHPGPAAAGQRGQRPGARGWHGACGRAHMRGGGISATPNQSTLVRGSRGSGVDGVPAPPITRMGPHTRRGGPWAPAEHWQAGVSGALQGQAT